MEIEEFKFDIEDDGSVYIHLNESTLTDIVKDADGATFFAYDSMEFELLEKSDLFKEGK